MIRYGRGTISASRGAAVWCERVARAGDRLDPAHLSSDQPGGVSADDIAELDAHCVSRQHFVPYETDPTR